MTRDQAFIHACDEANKTRPLTDAEVDQLCVAIERDRKYQARLASFRERYRRDPEFRARRIQTATARYHARKGASA